MVVLSADDADRRLKAARTAMWVVGVLAMIAGLIVFLASRDATTVPDIDPSRARVFGIVSLVIGALYLVLGAAVRRGSRGAIWAGLVLVGLNLAQSVIAVTQANDAGVQPGTYVVGLVINVLLLVLLWRALQATETHGSTALEHQADRKQ